MTVVREDSQCWSLANAFEKPIYSTGRKGLIQASVEALDAYWKKLTNFYGDYAIPVVSYLDGKESLDSLKNAWVESLDSWVKAVVSALPQG